MRRFASAGCRVLGIRRQPRGTRVAFRIIRPGQAKWTLAPDLGAIDGAARVLQERRGCRCRRRDRTRAGATAARAMTASTPKRTRVPM